MHSGNVNTLCMIHGWGFDTRVMQTLAAAIAAQREVELLDMPGYGKLRASAAFPGSMDDMAVALAARIPDRCVLLGWSLGGMLALKIAHLVEARVSAIILLASTPCFVRKPGWAHGMAPERIDDLGARIEKNPERTLVEFAMLIAQGDSTPKRTLLELKKQLIQGLPDMASLSQGLDILRTADLRNEFAGLSCPVIMLLAERDEIIMQSAGADARTLRPSLYLEYIKAAGHAPFIEKPELVAGKINSVLQAATV